MKFNNKSPKMIHRQINYWNLKLIIKLIIALFILTPSLCIAQLKLDLPTPPGCVKIADSVFIDKTEIANIHWLEYLYFLQVDSSSRAVVAAQLDSNYFPKYDTTSGRKVSDYLNAPEFRYYPVVGISHLQAKNYCRWRTEIVNTKLMKGSKFNYLFRLPTEKEWEYAASGGLDLMHYPYGYEQYTVKPTLIQSPKKYYATIKDTSSLSRKDFKLIFKNYLLNGDESIFNVQHEFPLGIKYGANGPLSTYNTYTLNRSPTISNYNQVMKPNRFGITDMIGNVAEMVEEKGIAKGGSWMHDLGSSNIKNRQYYQRPTTWLGFRCVCEVNQK